MPHVVILEDEAGEVVDVNYYCSDYCARGDDAYAGWYGDAEPPYVDTPCGGCGTTITGEGGE